MKIRKRHTFGPVFVTGLSLLLALLVALGCAVVRRAPMPSGDTQACSVIHRGYRLDLPALYCRESHEKTTGADAVRIESTSDPLRAAQDSIWIFYTQDEFRELAWDKLTETGFEISYFETIYSDLVRDNCVCRDAERTTEMHLVELLDGRCLGVLFANARCGKLIIRQTFRAEVSCDRDQARAALEELNQTAETLRVTAPE